MSEYRNDAAPKGWVVFTICALVAMGVSAPTMAAATPTVLESAFSDAAGFAAMDKADMARQRGGYDGIAFGIFLSGTLNQPATTTVPNGLTVSTLSPNQVQIVGGVGNLAGASGIFQFTNVVGNMNVINNNIIINVTVQPGSPTNSVTLIP
jgi:hypothetical protein